MARDVHRFPVLNFKHKWQRRAATRNGRNEVIPVILFFIITVLLLFMRNLLFQDKSMQCRGAGEGIQSHMSFNDSEPLETFRF